MSDINYEDVGYDLEAATEELQVAVRQVKSAIQQLPPTSYIRTNAEAFWLVRLLEDSGVQKPRSAVAVTVNTTLEDLRKAAEENAPEDALPYARDTER